MRKQTLMAAILGVGAAGCDPVVSIAGAYFPGWLAAILIGAGLTFAARYLIVATGLEPHIGPRVVVYPSLGLLLILLAWLVLYRS